MDQTSSRGSAARTHRLPAGPNRAGLHVRAKHDTFHAVTARERSWCARSRPELHASDPGSTSVSWRQENARSHWHLMPRGMPPREVQMSSEVRCFGFATARWMEALRWIGHRGRCLLPRSAPPIGSCLSSRSPNLRKQASPCCRPKKIPLDPSHSPARLRCHWMVPTEFGC